MRYDNHGGALEHGKLHKSADCYRRGIYRAFMHTYEVDNGKFIVQQEHIYDLGGYADIARGKISTDIFFCFQSGLFRCFSRSIKSCQRGNEFYQRS